MKLLSMAFGILMMSSSAFATTAQDFYGSYDLFRKNSGELNCWSGVVISKENAGTAIFRKDIGYAPMMMAEVNGASRSVKSSHGEGFTSARGQEKVTYQNGYLIFSYRAVESMFAVPLVRVSEDIKLNISQDRSRLLLRYETQSGLVAGTGKKQSVECVYQRSDR